MRDSRLRGVWNSRFQRPTGLTWRFWLPHGLGHRINWQRPAAMPPQIPARCTTLRALPPVVHRPLQGTTLTSRSSLRIANSAWGLHPRIDSRRCGLRHRASPAQPPRLQFSRPASGSTKWRQVPSPSSVLHLVFSHRQASWSLTRMLRGWQTFIFSFWHKWVGNYDNAVPIVSGLSSHAQLGRLQRQRQRPGQNQNRHRQRTARIARHDGMKNSSTFTSATFAYLVHERLIHNGLQHRPIRACVRFAAEQRRAVACGETAGPIRTVSASCGAATSFARCITSLLCSFAEFCTAFLGLAPKATIRSCSAAKTRSLRVT